MPIARDAAGALWAVPAFSQLRDGRGNDGVNAMRLVQPRSGEGGFRRSGRPNEPKENYKIPRLHEDDGGNDYLFGYNFDFQLELHQPWRPFICERECCACSGARHGCLLIVLGALTRRRFPPSSHRQSIFRQLQQRHGQRVEDDARTLWVRQPAVSRVQKPARVLPRVG